MKFDFIDITKWVSADKAAYTIVIGGIILIVSKLLLPQVYIFLSTDPDLKILHPWGLIVFVIALAYIISILLSYIKYKIHITRTRRKKRREEAAQYLHIRRTQR